MNPRGSRRMFGDALGALWRILTERENFGAAAVEFAIFVPVFVAIVAGTVDLGYLMYTASELTAAVSAGAQYAETNPTDPGLAAKISAVVESGRSGATSTVNVNNGTNNCYCPTGPPGNWTWGTAKCSEICPGAGGVAGKFVTITASRTVSPLFPTFGLTTISRSAIVETATQ